MLNSINCRGFHSCLCFNTIIKTIPSNLTNKELELMNYCKIIKALFVEYKDEGRISKSFFDSLLMLLDKDQHGEIAEELRRFTCLSYQ